MALDEVSFSLGQGELLAIVGPNGSGKTSLLNVISGVHRPASGWLRFRGADLLRLPPRRLAAAGIARTFQNPGLVGGLTVLDNVLLGRHHLLRSGVVRGGLYVGRARREEVEHRRAAREAMRFAGVERLEDVRVASLPYGTQKRVEFARMVAMEPSLVLLDEPLAGMDGPARAEITALVDRLHHERDLGILLVEHDMAAVMRVSQRILVLESGRPIAVGTPAEVAGDPAVRRAYLGSAEDRPR